MALPDPATSVHAVPVSAFGDLVRIEWEQEFLCDPGQVDGMQHVFRLVRPEVDGEPPHES